jgi:hypothetical protein
MFDGYRDSDASLLIRADFINHAAWHALCDLVQQPNPSGGFQALFVCVDDPKLAEIDIDAPARQAKAELDCGAIFIADAEAIGGADHAVLCVDCVDSPGASFRVIPAEIWGPETNLRLSNMDYAEFANAAGPNGVFRGFPG